MTQFSNKNKNRVCDLKERTAKFSKDIIVFIKTKTFKN